MHVYFHGKNEKRTIYIALNGGYENKKNAGHSNDCRQTTHSESLSVQVMQ
jgi:hypothetical protein